MTTRKIIAATLFAATAGLSTGALASGDADVKHAQRLLEEARNFGKSTTGQAAGEVRRDREQRVEKETRSANEQRWEDIRKAQSLN